MLPVHSRVFMFLEHDHFACTRLPFVDRTLNLFYVVSNTAFERVKTYCREGQYKPCLRKRLVVSCPFDAIITLVLKEHGIDHLLDSRCHVYASMFIEYIATELLASVSMDVQDKNHVLGI